jgi:hypothetical protein
MDCKYLLEFRVAIIFLHGSLLLGPKRASSTLKKHELKTNNLQSEISGREKRPQSMTKSFRVGLAFK